MIYKLKGPQAFKAVQWDFKVNFYNPRLESPVDMSTAAIRVAMANLRDMIKVVGTTAHWRMVYATNLEMYEAVLERRGYIKSGR